MPRIRAVGQEARLFAEAARQGGLEADIETCPGWNMRDLVRHQSEIHLWATARVARRTSKLWPDDISERTESWPELAVFWPDDHVLIDWYLKTNANLVQALESASPHDDIPTFLPAPSPLATWARRQAHETSGWAQIAGPSPGRGDLKEAKQRGLCAAPAGACGPGGSDQVSHP